MISPFERCSAGARVAQSHADVLTVEIPGAR
jgi:hypothetical protein